MSKWLSEKDLYRTKTKEGRYPISRSNLLLMIERGDFPPPVHISPSRKVWPLEILEEHDRRLVEQARKASEQIQAKKAAEQRREAAPARVRSGRR